VCGIAGFAGRDDPLAVQAVARMVSALGHRGPDDRDVTRLPGAVLGHTRLSIIDLASGHQPLATADRRYTITFNGEIYNYRDLRRQLEAGGFPFRTHSDTEVLLAAYCTWGTRAFARLNGMYACVIWDAMERRLVALRDRTGKKPFYYVLLADGSMAFASEVKALLASGLVRGRASVGKIDAYLALGYLPPDRSIYQDIEVLPAAASLSWSGGRGEVERYWTPRIVASGSIAEQEAAAEIRRRVDDAVRRRMIADVPIGAFLSGGLDSTTVVTLMARHSPQPIKTFSVGFGTHINELPGAGAVARHLGTEHHEIQVDLRVGELLASMAAIYDEPLADSSSIPTFVVSRFAREHVKVVLTGDGGDELFGGYEWWYRPLAASERLTKGQAAHACMRFATRLLSIGQRLGLPLGPALRSLWESRRLFELAREHPDLWERQRANATRFSASLRRSLWKEQHRPLVQTPPAAQCPGDVRGMNRAFWFDVTSYLPGDILVKLDRASMAVGLEARCPLLDPELIEFALSLPASLKLRGDAGKYVFKKAFESSWPEAVKTKAKHGFGGPEAAWLRRADVRPMVERVVSGADSPLSRWFCMDELRARTLAHYESQSGFTPSQLWSLLTLGLWAERWQSQTAA
jgi:asparagine synthase (glutamine-hydrolysing)